MANDKEPQQNSKTGTSRAIENERVDFDREYGLPELLPTPVLENIGVEIQNVAPAPVLVLLSDGSPYYSKGSLPPNGVPSISRVLDQERIDSIKELRSERGRITIFPITHELETIGYLILGYEKEGDRSSCPLIPFGRLLVKVLSYLIIYSHKNLLTSGLHGQVVEEWYAQLKQKAALLEKSEQKYRLLAESLVIEVEKKTKEIKETQAQLMQQEKMASIGHLSSGLAHELNNPMGFIISNLNALEIPCTQCGAHLEERFQFCPFCGGAIVLRCAGRGKFLDSTWKACPHCGEKVVSGN